MEVVRCVYPVFYWRSDRPARPSRLRAGGGGGGEESKIDEKCASFLCALSLLGAGVAVCLSGERRSYGCFARIGEQTSISASASASASSVAAQSFLDNKIAIDDQASDGAANMNEETRLAFENWKKVPYSISFPLRIVGLRGSVPPVWIKDFTLSQGKQLKLGAEFVGSIDAIYSQLASVRSNSKLTSKSAMAADVVTLGDSWLGAAIKNKLVDPIGKPDDLEWFRQLDPRWQAILRRDPSGHPSPNGDVWAAPYRCGCMVIAYRIDKLRKAGIRDIKDWDDLWQPELAGRISMIESTREVIGLVLKSLGSSYNAKNFDTEVPGGQDAVKNRFLTLRKQVRLFDNVNYLRALGAGDVWVAVGWSNDVVPFAKRQSNVGVIAPASGTSLWADVWAIPAATKIKSDKAGGRIRGPSPLVSQWLDFCLQPARSLGFHQEAFSGASPFRLSKAAIDDGFPEREGPRLDTNLVCGLPPRDILCKSEFLEPLDEDVVVKYHSIILIIN